MEQMTNEAYTIDLSYAVSASDIVYELSSIIDNDRAKNKRIALKLGDVDLNQSQLLSIRSLINSINSTVESLETTSEQTEAAAINLGIVVTVTREVAEQIENLPEPEAPKYVESYGYVKLEDHLPEEPSTEEANSAQEEEKAEGMEEVAAETEEQTADNEEPKVEEKHQTPEERNANVVVEDFASRAGAPVVNTEKEEKTDNIDSEEETKQEQEDVQLSLIDEIQGDVAISDEQAGEILEAKTEDIQDALDNIYTTEVKLESILESEQKENEEGTISAEEVRQAVLNEEKYTESDFEIDHFSTTYIKQTLRSGQIVNYDGNVVIIGDCHPGSEVIASGDITVWGILSGIAHAGAKGNERARVRALKMNAIQLRIANCYARKPDGMNTIFPERTSTFTPEEARVVNGEMVIFKIND